MGKTSFFKALKHNSDLCPQYELQLDFIMQSFNKYQGIVYDIQGFRDCGTDIIVRLPKNETETEHICFQVKSESDLKAKDYLKNLKAQYFDTSRRYNNLLDYYILLCCDSLVNKDKIRTITSEFAKEKNIHVIIPEYSLMFYQLGTIHIDSIIKARYGSEDEIYRKSLELIIDLTPTEKAIIFYFIWAKNLGDMDMITQNEIKASSFLVEIYKEVPDYDKSWFLMDKSGSENEMINGMHDHGDIEESGESVFRIRNLSLSDRVAEDLNALEDDFILQNNFGEYGLLYSTVLPLVVLLLDGHLRYKYCGDDLLRYMMGLFTPMKGYSFIN